jgi:8-oxo-dGTP pyrophosphatase MutT (NUDIX family)
VSAQPPEEQVAIIDPVTRQVVGSTPRSVMRRDNLPHLVAAVIVRDPSGRVYVHRRSDTKDVFPGLHDAMAAGTVEAGEDPEATACRELAEELGISGATLHPEFVQWFEDADTRHLAHVWSTVWDGPVVHQPEEIAWGAWMTPEELTEHLADPGWPFVPDGRALLETYGLPDPR